MFEKYSDPDKILSLKGDIERRRRKLGPCDKCSGDVPFGNDAVTFDSIMGTIPWHPLYSPNNKRHLRPVVDSSGVVICEGSPSRWQVISSTEDTKGFNLDEERSKIAKEVFSIMSKMDKTKDN